MVKYDFAFRNTKKKTHKEYLRTCYCKHYYFSLLNGKQFIKIIKKTQNFGVISNIFALYVVKMEFINCKMACVECFTVSVANCVYRIPNFQIVCFNALRKPIMNFVIGSTICLHNRFPPVCFS